MVTCNGYSIQQDIKHNRLVVNLPQTSSSITTTTIPMSGRRVSLTSEEEAALLDIVIAMYEGIHTNVKFEQLISMRGNQIANSFIDEIKE